MLDININCQNNVPTTTNFASNMSKRRVEHFDFEILYKHCHLKKYFVVLL